MMQHGAEPNSKMVKDVLKEVHAKGQGTGPKEEVGQVLYMRGLIARCWPWKASSACAGALRQGQGHDRRAGALGLREPEPDQKKLDALGFAGVMRPISTSCADHLGANLGPHAHLGRQASGTSVVRLVQADESDHQADDQGSGRQVRGEKKLTAPRTPAGLPELTHPRSAADAAPPQGGAARAARPPDPRGPLEGRTRLVAAFTFASGGTA
jgi:branched-chain amino acid transport system substrate-binding protein